MSEAEKISILAQTLGDYYCSNREYLFYCPKCSHHKKKLSVNFDKNKFKCWVCDYAGHSIRRIVRSYGGYSDLRDWDVIDGTVDLNVFENLFGAPVEEEPKEIVELPEEFISLTGKTLPLTARPAKEYLRQRGVSASDIVRWKVGYCPSGDYGGRIVIPSFELDGTLNYFVARSYSNHWRKYDQPAVSRNLVFNHLYVDWDSDVVIVEGVFDAFVAGSNSIPILGSTLKENSKLFQEIVAHDSAVYVALDPDAEKKAMRLISQLLEYGVELYKIDISPYGDVGEMFREDFEKRKREAIEMDQSNYLLYCAKNI